MKRLLVIVAVMLIWARFGWAAPRPMRIALLVVSQRSDLAMESRAQDMIGRLVALREAAGLSEKDIPVLSYHFDLPREGSYCSSKLAIQRADLPVLGVAEESGYVVRKVLARFNRVQQDEADTLQVWSRARQIAGAVVKSARQDQVLFSDSFSRADSDRCALGMCDNAMGGSQSLGYIPIFPAGGTDVSHPIGADIVRGTLRNNGLDVGGVQFANESGCTLFRQFGARLPQDLSLEADFKQPVSNSAMTAAGFYARSRSANVGDGIIGGDSSGYWVRLWSTGRVDVFNLHSSGGPNPFAESAQPARFDGAVPHHVLVRFVGPRLWVELDRRPVLLRQNGAMVTSVTLAPSLGSNNGTAGLAFASVPRGAAGGQSVTNLVVRARL